MKKTSNEIVKKILEFDAQGFTKNEIAKMLGISRRTVFNLLKESKTMQKENKKINCEEKINKVVNLHLLYHCEDLELLANMLNFWQPKKILIPERINKIVGEEKIKKIINLAQKFNDLEYKMVQCK